MLTSGRTIQDYVVVPQQLWLDGIASQDGKVRQFVAMPLGSGYSVEAQITGADLIGGLQLEVVPAKEFTDHSHRLHICICPPPPLGRRYRSLLRQRQASKSSGNSFGTAWEFHCRM